MMKNRFADWPEEYAAKLMDAADAVRMVKSGDRVAIPIGAITPVLAEALFARRNELHDVEVLTCAPFVDPGWFDPGHPAFRVKVEVFNTLVGRAAVNAHRSEFLSIPFSRRFKQRDERGESGPAEVLFVGVSGPDKFGWCSYGLSMWNKASFARRATTILAEVFPGYPQTGGTNRIHVSEIDAFVETGEMPPMRPGMLREDAPPFPPAIAGYINELVQDGDCVQIGTGATAGKLVTAGALDGKEDLGIHSEISVPGLNELVMRGTITGARKNVHPGKFVATALHAATPEEIDFIHENPVYEVYDVDYTNDINVIASNDRMIAINNAFAVDLYGQVASESLGHDLWSGPGGQAEFALGALLSKGGRNVTVLPSAAKGGEVSRIVLNHEPGTIVTVPRQFVDMVVTEYGIARLYGKTDRERANELISVAHPDHRAELRRQAGALLG